MDSKKALIELIESDAATEADFASAPLPQSMRCACTHRDEEGMFAGVPYEEKDPRKSLHVDEVAVPTPGPDEVLVGIMATCVNFNNVWTSIFEPSSGFGYIGDFAKMSPLNAKHKQDFHIPGCDAAGVVLRVGCAVRKWKPGDRVIVYGAVHDATSPALYDDGMRDPHLRAWGFETNYGSFAEFTCVQQQQLLAKPEHLTWEEAASMLLVAATAYRMLVSRNGARMLQGDNVLIWGAAGGLGCNAIQLVKNGGGNPIAVVSSEHKADIVRRLGCENVIVMPRTPGKERFLDANGHTNARQILRLKVQIRRFTDGEDCDIVFEHTGRSTFAASVAVLRPGGKVVTCGSTSGYDHVYDNRYLWQTVKSIVGSHGFNYYEAMRTSRLIGKGALMPLLSRVYQLSDAPSAVAHVHSGKSVGKVGILCLAPHEGLGIRNRAFREKLGTERFGLLREDEKDKDC